MTPLLIWKCGNRYLVDDIDARRKHPPGWVLVVTIEGSSWVEHFLNSDAKNRKAMIKKIEGRDIP